MDTTVLGLFDNVNQAQTAAQELVRSGVNQKDIEIVAGNQGGRTNVTDRLVDAGADQDEAAYYAEGVRQGGTLLMAGVPEQKAQQAYDIVSRYETVDVNERSAQWQQSGWNPPQTGTSRQTNAYSDQYATQQTTNTARSGQFTDTNDAVLPVVEEELQVGKRQVQRGGVRIYKRVTEKPVEAQVTLRDEQVNVERRAVNRPATEADLQNALRDTTIEVRETDEVPVVAKQARIVEEVVVNKNVEQRNETVRDTVRRTDVDVQRIEGQNSATSNYATYDTDFRNHYQTNFANNGYNYDQYSPVYRYGYDLASDQRYANQDWSKIESSARRDWEKANPNNPWDSVKDSIKYAWDKVRGRE